MVPDSPDNAAVLVIDPNRVPSRRIGADLAVSLGLNLVGVYEGPRKAGSPPEALILGALNRRFTTVVLGSLSALGPSPRVTMRYLAALSDAGVAVVSAAPGEEWVQGFAAVAGPVSEWMDHSAKEARTAALRAATGRSDRRPGRPRRSLDMAKAHYLLADKGLSVAAVARQLGNVPPSTLRARLSELKLVTLAASTKGESP
ncbi:MAG: hypothetical protein IPQ24_11295 [Anaeromyxobacter sp.]|nr:hypothetical protein [Anaeromyxobacter sp.]